MPVSPLDTAYNRLDEAHRAWHTALDGYHRIDDFRAGINTAIQALRNLTFALQKQKESLPDFDIWYAGWQEKMRANPILKELHEARNVIVKQEDLKLHSVATARTKGWIDFQKMAFAFDPTKDSYEVAQGFYNTFAKHLPVAEEIKSRLVFEFERKWVYDKLHNYELLEAITQAYYFFSEMLQDASQKFALPQRESHTTGEYCSGELNDKNLLKCMVLTPQERCLIFSFEDGASIKAHTESIERDTVHLDKVREKYGDEWKSEETLSLLDGLFPTEYPFPQMKLFAQVAVSNLKKDKYLVPTTFIFKGIDDVPVVIAHPFENQEQKVMTMDLISSSILKNNGKFVLTVAEVWQYDFNDGNPLIPTHENPNGAKDIFDISCISSEKLKVIHIPFHKNIFGKIIFSKPTVEDVSTDVHTHYILQPLIDALKQVK